MLVLNPLDGLDAAVHPRVGSQRLRTRERKAIDGRAPRTRPREGHLEAADAVHDLAEGAVLVSVRHHLQAAGQQAASSPRRRQTGGRHLQADAHVGAQACNGGLEPLERLPASPPRPRLVSVAAHPSSLLPVG